MNQWSGETTTPTPTKEQLVRRRLFATPQHKHSVRTQSRASIQQKNRQPQRRLIKLWATITVLVILGVHFHLLRNILNSQSSSSLRHSPSAPPLVAETPNKIVDVTPLEESDYEQYTIRLNTWRRNEQLLVSVDHHSRCPGVAQIQIVWCDDEHEPPAELLVIPKVVIERHTANSLNERFHVLQHGDIPTAGVLSLDDDVIRPCEALDAGFFQWTQHYDRMVGFDARTHEVAETSPGTTTWKYGYMSTMEKTNKYSLSLTRCCFLHRDYLQLYMAELPNNILEKVAHEFNCEDIAMSFLISSLTGGKPSLLADVWAMKSMIKLYAEEKISGTSNHKSIRDECVNSFAQQLGLKEDGPHPLQFATYMHRHDSFFSAGDFPSSPIPSPYPKPKRQVRLERLIHDWHKLDGPKLSKEITKLMSQAGHRAFKQGLMEGTDVWKQRFGIQHHHQQHQNHTKTTAR